MSALVLFETIYTSHVLVLRVPAFCYVAPVQAARDGSQVDPGHGRRRKCSRVMAHF